MDASKKDTVSSEEKDIILLVGTAAQHAVVMGVREYEKKHEKRFTLALIRDSRKDKGELNPEIEIPLSCDFNSDTSLAKTLLPYKSRLFTIICRGEHSIPLLQKVIPHVPYLKTPTVRSLKWATSKILMRQMMEIHDKNITPHFLIVTDTKKATLKTIEEKVGFPLIVKPSGLAASLLVSVCFHKEELHKVLKNAFKKIASVHKANNGRGEPQLLVEQFMEGEMYSVDGYVNDNGTVMYCPLVHIKTGYSVGFDDFFAYRTLTPTRLTKNEVHGAERAATAAVHALGLRNTTVHVELMRTENGQWKIIELGPRIGGFRQKMYQLSFGINHTMNDALIHAGERPIIPRKVRGYSAALKFFAKKEGVLVKLTGVKKAQELESIVSLDVNKKIGDRCSFAKNGGKSVFNVILFNEDRSKLLADIRRLEQMICIETK